MLHVALLQDALDSLLLAGESKRRTIRLTRWAIGFSIAVAASAILFDYVIFMAS